MKKLKEKYISFFMTVARETSRLSYCVKNKVGSVIVKNNNILSIGYNSAVSGVDNCCEDNNGKTLGTILHSEENAIIECARQGKKINGSIIFTTLSPCLKCARMIAQVGIKAVYFEEIHDNGEGAKWLKENTTVKVIKIDKQIKE
jgi:dCMP deaminase